MGQQEVIDFLDKQTTPMSRGEIAEGMAEDPIKISKIINKLLKYEEIKCVEIDRHEANKRFKCRRRIMLYFT